MRASRSIRAARESALAAKVFEAVARSMADFLVLSEIVDRKHLACTKPSRNF